MAKIREVPLTEIDPESTVNVRRAAVQENVDRVKRSIKTHGYWQDQPVTLRPHPDEDSQYNYEYVTGQCRFKASAQLGLDSIFALVVRLDDDEALRRSWGENEARGDLSPSDQAYWAEKIFRKYDGEGYTMSEALQKAAKWLGVSLQTLQRYYRWAFLPAEVQEMMDQGVLLKKHASAIVQNTYVRQSSSGADDSTKRMIDRAEWIVELDRKSRDLAAEAMERLSATASIAELAQYVRERRSEKQRTLQYRIPQELYENLLQYGRQRGLQEPETIVSHIIADAVQGD